MEPEPAPNWSIPDVLFTAVNEVITNAYTPFYPDNSNISKPATSMLAQWEKPTQLFDHSIPVIRTAQTEEPIYRTEDTPPHFVVQLDGGGKSVHYQ
jgi:hypothetical protein